MAMSPQSVKTKKRFPLLRVVAALFIVKAVVIAAFLVTILANKESAYEEVIEVVQIQTETIEAPRPFPISVNPTAKTITEDPTVDSFLTTYLAYESVKPVRNNWWRQITRKLATRDWYQSLASPISRILVVWPGDRKEEVIDNFGDILRWDTTERETFATIITIRPPALPDGTFFPGRYVTTKDASPEAVATLLFERFETEVQARYPAASEEIIPLKDALIVASLLEREAYAFDQMREISGVIWNRLFSGMPLQLDATLQYVKGSSASETAWWPQINPDDKYLDSAFNTYKHKGLPPSPIANPSAASILAALNPIETDCLFYFHTENGDMHCSVTYEEHVKKLKQQYGQGR